MARTQSSEIVKKLFVLTYGRSGLVVSGFGAKISKVAQFPSTLEILKTVLSAVIPFKV